MIAASAPSHPLFLRLEGRRVLVVGGGAVALEKASALREAGAELVVVAPSIRPEFQAIARELHPRPFTDADVDGAWLVISAAPHAVNRAVHAAAEERRVFIVAVDDVASCTAIGAAKLQRQGLTIAISSDGRAPALVALLRRAIEALLPHELEAWFDVARAARVEWKSAGVPIEARRPLLLRALNDLYFPNDRALREVEPT